MGKLGVRWYIVVYFYCKKENKKKSVLADVLGLVVLGILNYELVMVICYVQFPFILSRSYNHSFTRSALSRTRLKLKPHHASHDMHLSKKHIFFLFKHFYL